MNFSTLPMTPNAVRDQPQERERGDGDGHLADVEAQ